MSQSIPAFLPEAVLLTAVVFGPLAFGAVETWSVAVLESLLILAALLCAARGLSVRRHPAYRTFLPAVGVLLVIGLAQVLNPHSAAMRASPLPFSAAGLETGRALLLWTSYAALLLAAPQILSTRAARSRFLWTVFGLGAVVAVIGLMQRGQGNAAYYGLRPIRHGNPFGPYTNYDHAASMLVLAAFSGLGLALSRWPLLRSIEQVGKLVEAWMLQLLIVFFLGVILYAIAYIRSRGAIHGMAFGAALVSAGAVLRFSQGKARAAAGALLVVTSVIYGVLMVRNKVMIGFERDASSTLFRLSLFKNSAEIAEDFPVFGTGLASYDAVFPAYENRGLVENRVDHVHNDWLELLIQTGITGFAAYVIGLTALYAAAVRGWFESRSFESRCLTAAALAATLSFCFHGMVDFSFQIPANAVLFLTLLICASASAQTDLEPAVA